MRLLGLARIVSLTELGSRQETQGHKANTWLETTWGTPPLPTLEQVTTSRASLAYLCRTGDDEQMWCLAPLATP